MQRIHMFSLSAHSNNSIPKQHDMYKKETATTVIIIVMIIHRSKQSEFTTPVML